MARATCMIEQFKKFDNDMIKIQNNLRDMDSQLEFQTNKKEKEIGAINLQLGKQLRDIENNRMVISQSMAQKGIDWERLAEMIESYKQECLEYFRECNMEVQGKMKKMEYTNTELSSDIKRSNALCKQFKHMVEIQD